MSKVGIVAALEREVRPLIRGWRVSEKDHAGRRFRFFEKDQCVLVCGGIGGEAARRAAEAIAALYAPLQIYSAGFAGALDPKLKVGDALLPHRIVDAGDGSSAIVARGQGVLVTFGSVASPEQKRKLRESYSADAVDMEAAAVARVAELHGADFAALKVISDASDFTFPELDRFIDAEGKFREGRFAWHVTLRPWLWSSVVRLARNSNQASRILCEQLANLLKTEASPVHARE
jgi:adenosylhomocysteine nucleosidase